jgi:hypothetical protein
MCALAAAAREFTPCLASTVRYLRTAQSQDHLVFAVPFTAPTAARLFGERLQVQSTHAPIKELTRPF